LSVDPVIITHEFLFQGGCIVSEVEPPPEGCVHCHNTLLTPGAVAFVSSLVEAFSSQVDEVGCWCLLSLFILRAWQAYFGLMRKCLYVGLCE